MLSLEELIVEFVDFGDSQQDATSFAQQLLGDFDQDGNGKLDLDELTESYIGGAVMLDDDDQGDPGDEGDLGDDLFAEGETDEDDVRTIGDDDWADSVDSWFTWYGQV